MSSRRDFLMHLGAAAVALAGGGGTHAQPGRPLALVVGFPPGGGPDLVARALAERARRDLGQPILVDNRTGAGGRIALDWLRNAAADGSNFVLTPALMLTAYPHIYKKLSYSPADFEPVCRLCQYHLSIVTRAEAPYSSLQEFVAWARSNKRATLGVPGLGTSPDFVGSLLARAEKLQLEPIVYRGGPQLTQAALAGEVDVAVNLSSNFVELAKAGRLKLLAVSAAARSRFSPEVPTLAELGYADMVFVEYLAIVARKGTPGQTVQHLQELMQAALQDPMVRDTLLRAEYLPGFKPARLLAADLAASSERWKILVEKTGFKPID